MHNLSLKKYLNIMKSIIKLSIVLSGLMLLQACVNTPFTTPSTDLYHSVQSREDVASISNIYGCRDHIELAHVNKIPPPYMVYPGQTIRIPANICGIVENYSESPSSADYYIARKGDTLYSISKAYNVSLNNLASWNSLKPPFTLSIGQQLKTTPPTENKFNTVEYNIPSTPRLLKSRSHVVAKGENLYRISKKYGYSVTMIARWNNIPKPYIISLGQRLIVSPPSATGYSTGTSKYNSGYNTNYATHHLVRAGETLQGIASRYNLTVEKLSAWNGLGAPYYIYLNQRLRLAPP